MWTPNDLFDRPPQPYHPNIFQSKSFFPNLQCSLSCYWRVAVIGVSQLVCKAIPRIQPSRRGIQRPVLRKEEGHHMMDSQEDSRTKKYKAYHEKKPIPL